MSLKRNPNPTDKAGEKALYRELILATPKESYLRTVLTKSQSFVFGNIDNDIAWPVQEGVRYIDENIEASKTQLAKLKEQIASAEQHLRRVKDEIYAEERAFDLVVRNAESFVDSISEVKSGLRQAVEAVKKSKKERMV